MLLKGYEADESELGNVYYPSEGITIPEKIIVNYVVYPWITCFQVDGVEIIKKDKNKNKSFEGGTL